MEVAGEKLSPFLMKVPNVNLEESVEAGISEKPEDKGLRDPFLSSLGEKVRSLRARKGMTRKAFAKASNVSERHIANLEMGAGNPSVLVLRQIAQALGSELAELFGDVTTSSAEWLLIRDLLHNRSDEELRKGRLALTALYGEAADSRARMSRIALVGLRGAGKSTLGQMLADSMGVPFVELNRELERVSGCSVSEIHNLLGQAAYRRHERRALEETIQLYPDAVIATPGGIVSDPATFNLLLSHCFTVWVKASPEEHMQRVMAQGDLRPMSGNSEAMDDLRRILNERSALYARADLSFDTTGKTVDESFTQLRASLRQAVGR